MFDFNIFRAEFEEKNWQNQMQIPKLISSFKFSLRQEIGSFRLSKHGALFD